jgi:hypothetical protein
MATPASKYHRGDMDIQEQEATYSAVMAGAKWGSLLTAAGLLFLTMWFCTGAGFLGGLITAAVVVVLGGLVLRDGGGH